MGSRTAPSPFHLDSYEDTELFGNDMSSVRSLGDVPEDGVFTPTSPHLENSPYINQMNPATSSTSTVQAMPPGSGSTSTIRTSKKSQTPSVRTLGGGKSSETLPPGGIKRNSSSSSTITSSKDGRTQKNPSTSTAAPLQKTRNTPRLPYDNDVELAPSTSMYWSRAPVYGTIPVRSMRAHTVTLVDTTAWVFGGSDDKDNYKTTKDLYCFDTETMQWSQRDTVGELPPPSRAHTTTLVDRKLFVFGGGHGLLYYNHVYVLDIATRCWSRPNITGPSPNCRRAHTAVLYEHKIWIFGGGNGMEALDDVWALDVSVPSRMKWEKVKTTGKGPGPRGYHSANLVGNVMIIIGGSNAKEFFQDIWCLDLDTLVWNQIQLGAKKHRRIAHSATQVGSYLFIVGGHNGTEYCSDLLLFNLVSLQYEQRQALGKPPPVRGYHSTILSDSRLFLFGGFNGTTAYDDVHILDLAAGAYLPQVTSFSVELQ